MANNIRQLPPLSILLEQDRNLGLRVTLAQIAVYADLLPRLATLGITHPTRMTALHHIAATPGCNQSDLARHTGLSRVSAMAMTKQLLAAGLIDCRDNARGRAKALHLTARGALVRERGIAHARANEELLFSILDPAEYAELGALLDKVLLNAAEIQSRAKALLDDRSYNGIAKQTA